MKRPRLTQAQIDEICELAELGLRAPAIGKRIGRHASTVAWHLYRLGYRSAQQRDEPVVYRRGSVIVRQYSREEDELLLARRREGATLKAIAEELTEKYGHRRSAHSVHVRLVALSRDDDEGGDDEP